MSTRRRFSGEFKAKVALEALRGDKTIQEIAARHKIHPNQVSTWKQRAVEGMKEVFSKGAERGRGDHEAELRDLHAKIGELTVERDFWPKGSSGEPGGAPGDDRARPSQAQLEPSMPAASCEPIFCVPQAQG
jgi:transposase-like protein